MNMETIDRLFKIMTSFVPRISKLTIIAVDRESLLNAVIHFKRPDGRLSKPWILSLKDTCTRRLLLHFGDDHEIYRVHLSSQLIRYVTYDYLTRTNNSQDRLINNDKFLSDLKLLFCRDCSLNDLERSKCRRRKCLANRTREVLHDLSCLIIPWEKQQCFSILDNDEEDEDNPIVFIQLKSNSSRYGKLNDQNSIQGQLYLFDLLRILQIDMVQQ